MLQKIPHTNLVENFPLTLGVMTKAKGGRGRENLHVGNYDIRVKCKSQVAVVQFFLQCTNKVSTLQAYLPVLTTTPFLGLGLVTQSHEATNLNL